MSYTVRQIADRYGVTQHTVLAWIRSGELTAVNVGRSPRAGKPRWRITAEQLEQFERSRQSQPAAAPRRRRQKYQPTYY